MPMTEKLEMKLMVDGKEMATVPLEGPMRNKLLGAHSEALFWNSYWNWQKCPPYSIQIRVARLGTKEEIAGLEAKP